MTAIKPFAQQPVNYSWSFTRVTVLPFCRSSYYSLHVQMDQLPQYVPSLEMPRSFLSRPAVLGVVAGFLIPILVPFFHFGIVSHLWDEFNYKVDIRGCSCSCWDTVFKGILLFYCYSNCHYITKLEQVVFISYVY